MCGITEESDSTGAPRSSRVKAGDKLECVKHAEDSVPPPPKQIPLA